MKRMTTTGATLALVAALGVYPAGAQAPQPAAQPAPVAQPAPAAQPAPVAQPRPAGQPPPAAAAGGHKVERVLGEQSAADKAAAASQAKIDQLADQTQDMIGKYRKALADTASLKKYNEQLAAQVKSQGERMATMKQQLVEIENTQRDVLPLMQKMIDTLEQFVQLDVPFLIEERTKRVATLKGLMGRADVSTSEKYRRILEAYQIEMEYGRTLEAYEGKLGEGDDAKTVQFVRVGRVSLLYQTPDGRETGYWDAEEKKWVAEDDYEHDAREAIRVAKKQGAPDLLWVPVQAPTTVQPSKGVKQ